MPDYGFTGTQVGCTPAQAVALYGVLESLPDGTLHTGDCIGADTMAHAIWKHRLGRRSVGHPPEDTRKRSYCDFDEEREPRPYMTRNDDIVAAGVDGLVVCPKGQEEELRSGTWATVRRARRAGRSIIIIGPDGSVMRS